MAVQHSCERLLRFVLPDNNLTVDMEVINLTGVYIFLQDKHFNEKRFISWSKYAPPPAFLKRVKENQTKKSKEFLA